LERLGILHDFVRIRSNYGRIGENMNTKMNAIAMTLLMIASALAGCTSGDPDGDGTSGIDMEILNEMIDDNLQDFIAYFTMAPAVPLE